MKILCAWVPVVATAWAFAAVAASNSTERVIWFNSFAVSDLLYSSNGSLVQVTRDPDQDAVMSSYLPDGTKEWDLSLPGRIWTKPYNQTHRPLREGRDGNYLVLLESPDLRLVSVSPEGDLVFDTILPASANICHACGFQSVGDDRAYISGTGYDQAVFHAVFAVNGKGELVWEKKYTDRSPFGAFAGPDGKVWVTYRAIDPTLLQPSASDLGLMAVSGKDGSVLADFPIPNPGRNSMDFHEFVPKFENGLMMFVLNDEWDRMEGTAYIVNTQTFQVRNHFWKDRYDPIGNPIRRLDGTILQLFADGGSHRDGYVVAYDPLGDELWSTKLPYPPTKHRPLMSKDGKLAVLMTWPHRYHEARWVISVGENGTLGKLEGLGVGNVVTNPVAILSSNDELIVAGQAMGRAIVQTIKPFGGWSNDWEFITGIGELRTLHFGPKHSYILGFNTGIMIVE